MRCNSKRHEWTDPADAEKCCDGVHARAIVDVALLDCHAGDVVGIARAWVVCDHNGSVLSIGAGEPRCTRCNASGEQLMAAA